MKNRRTFLMRAASILAVAGFGFLTKKSEAKSVKLSGTLIHHVFFWLKEPQNNEYRRRFEKALDELVKVKTIKISHIGIPASTEKRDVVDHSYTYSLLVMFGSREDQEEYQVDPIHKKFVDDNSWLWSKVLVYDSVDQ